MYEAFYMSFEETGIVILKTNTQLLHWATARIEGCALAYNSFA
jgi:hypothetical protein